MRTDFVQAGTVNRNTLNILAEYLALPEPQRFLHIFHSIGHSPNVEVATRCAGVLDRFVSQTVWQCLASGRTLR